MKLITQRDLIREVAERWKKHYWNQRYGWYVSWKEVERKKGAEIIWNELCKLDIETCTAEDIKKIVGYDSLILLDCSFCGNNYCEEVVEIEGDEGTSTICQACVVAINEIFARGSPNVMPSEKAK